MRTTRMGGGDITRQKVHAVSEVTVMECKLSGTIKETVRQKSYLMFTSRVNHCFTVCLDFAHNSFTLTVIDRAGLIHSETMKVVENSHTLLHIIVGLMFGRLSDISYDETIVCDGDSNAIYIVVGKKKYCVVEE